MSWHFAETVDETLYKHFNETIEGMETEQIRVIGARAHNLSDVDVTVPKRKLTVVTGVSGSGKSSLVFDTVAAEAQRQLYETLPAFVRGFLPSYGHPDVDMIEHLAPVVMVDRGFDK